MTYRTPTEEDMLNLFHDDGIMHESAFGPWPFPSFSPPASYGHPMTADTTLNMFNAGANMQSHPLTPIDQDSTALFPQYPYHPTPTSASLASPCNPDDLFDLYINFPQHCEPRRQQFNPTCVSKPALMPRLATITLQEPPHPWSASPDSFMPMSLLMPSSSFPDLPPATSSLPSPTPAASLDRDTSVSPSKRGKPTTTPTRPKAQRNALSASNRAYMMSVFNKTPMPCTSELTEIAEKVGITLRSSMTDPHVFRCVQCDEFVTAGECRFHSEASAATGREGDSLKVCGCQAGGCHLGTHRQAAHTDYKYSAFFAELNTLLDKQRILTTVEARETLVVVGVTDDMHPTHPNHLFLYATPNGRSHPRQTIRYFSADNLNFVSLRVSMAQLYDAGPRESVLKALHIVDESSHASVAAEWISNDIGGIIGIQVACKAATASASAAITNIYFSHEDNQFRLVSINVLSTFDAAPKIATHLSNTQRRMSKRLSREAGSRSPPPHKWGYVQDCVQCGTSFLESENFDHSCRFHTMENGSCCMRGTVPCASGRHRTEHHTEYSYAAYQSYLKDFFKHDHELFGRGCHADDLSFDPMLTLSLSCGITLPTHVSNPDKFFVFLKCGHDLNQQFLMLFDRADLMVDASSLDPVIRKYEDAVGNFAQVEWIMEDEEIIGVQMHVQSSTMQTPSITRVLFEFESWDAPTPICGTLAILSESHFGELAPPLNQPYPTLPSQTDTFVYHPPGSTLLGIPRPRPAQKFHPIAQHGCPLKLNFVSVDCFRSNPTQGGDQFLLIFDLVNRGQVAVEIQEFHCRWKLGGGEEWLRATISEDSVSRGGGGAGQILGDKWATVKLFVDVGPEWGGVARLGSLLFDVELVCVGGSTVSLTLEHTPDQIYTIPEPETPTHASILLESTTTHNTVILDIASTPTNDQDMFSISFLGRSTSVSLNQLRVAVITALRRPELGGVVPLFEESRVEVKCSVTAKAVVDSASRCVYAIRVDAVYEDVKAVRFFAVAPYGDAVLLDAERAGEVVEAKDAVEGLVAFEVVRGFVFRGEEGVRVGEERGFDGVEVDGKSDTDDVTENVDMCAIEERVGALVERQMNEFMAKMMAMMAPPPPPPPSVTQISVAVDQKLDLILSKLVQMDSRMQQLEQDHGYHKHEVSEKLETVVTSVENLAFVTEKSVQEAVTSMTVALEAYHFDPQEDETNAAEAFDDLARRLENVGISAQGLTESIQEMSALSDLADRLEAVAELASTDLHLPCRAIPASGSVDEGKLDRVLEALSARMEKMEHLSTIGDVVTSGFKQIVMKQTELDVDVRSSLARAAEASPSPSTRSEPIEMTEVVSKLNDLEARIEILPQVYREMMDSLLDRQTSTLVSSISEVRAPRSPVHSPAPRGLSPLSRQPTPTLMTPTPSETPAAAGKRSSYRIPAVPNMGIAVGLSKLTGRYNKRSSTDSDEAL
ncbi:hypothetical protein HDU98_007358 [Podochytrium sp. JEL0797]|nr:hypothetical protein HDU98_007358 [Podochytrium sp. JEL0797]